MLEARGYHVLAAGDAGTAAELAAASRSIDLIFCDLAVGGSNGREIAERIRELHPGARCLYMSGYTDDSVVRRGVIEPGAAFIEKPFSSDELARQVRLVIDGRSGQRSAA
jgi:two-component system, cell cycle sensor histidine kinase and response regulator CckA